MPGPVTTSASALHRLLLAVVLLIATPTIAAAHLGLRSSTPAAGAQLTTAPRTLRLQFTQALRISAVRVSLRLADAALDLPTTLALDPNDASVVVVSIGAPLGDGAYAAEWRVIGADGHPVTGTIRFTVLAAANATQSDTLDEHAGHEMSGADEHAGHDSAATGAQAEHGDGSSASAPHADSPVAIATRALGFVALLLLIGTAVFTWRVLPAALTAVPESEREATIAAAWRLGSVAALASLVHAVARLAQQVRLAAIGEGGFADWLSISAGGAWGTGFWLQVAASAVAMLAFRTRRLAIALPAAAVLAIVPALSGHAVAQSAAATIVDALHVFGAGAWLGSLAVVGLVLLRPNGVGHRVPGVASVAIRAFSPLALVAAGTVVASGSISAFWRLGGWPSALGEPYLRWLLAKLAVVALVFAIGAYNWRRVLPRIGEGTDGMTRLARSASFELALGLLVLILTAVLIFVPPPAFAALSPAS